jgi:CRP-like cAMP-binding protein
VDMAALEVEANRNETLRNLIFRYHSAFLVQTMQCAACNGLHTVMQRCCRWLLMSHDRAQSDVVPLTHEFLALMLGVRRASVTDVLRPLQERSFIRLNRGEIVVTDRKGLEACSCECYRVIKNLQKQLLG